MLQQYQTAFGYAVVAYCCTFGVLADVVGALALLVRPDCLPAEMHGLVVAVLLMQLEVGCQTV